MTTQSYIPIITRLPHKPAHDGSEGHPTQSDILLPPQYHLMTGTPEAASPSGNRTDTLKTFPLTN